MRVAFVITRSDQMGGASMHVRDLAVGLREGGHDVVVLTGGEGEFSAQLDARGLGRITLRHLVRPVRPWHELRATAEITDALRSWSPDIVATHSSKAGLFGRLAARRLGIPSTFTAHGWAFTEGTGAAALAYRYAERWAAPLAARLITVSDYDRALALRARVGTPDQLVTIHNGVPDVAPGLRAEPGRTPVRIVMVGRLERQKDHATLLRALAGLRDLQWRLTLIGTGPLTAALKQQARALGLAERVEFLGARRDVAEVLATAQLFVLASNWEGFPLSALEAMRASLPVVASDVGGVGEAVTDGATGRLVPPRDAGALAAALRGMIEDPGLRRQCGAAGRARWEREFTFDGMYRRTVGLYQAVVGEARE